MTPNNRPPAPDEFELTVLGRGVGESCVEHLGNGRWMVVDSFNEPRDAPRGPLTPAAQVYLERLGVAPSAVEWIVITHFHDDHIGGIEALHDCYSSAKLFVPAALKEATFLRLYDAQVREPLAGLTGTIVRAAERVLASAAHKGLAFVSTSHMIARHVNDPASDPLVEVLALSPSDQAVVEAAKELRYAMDSDPRLPALKRHLRDENRTSVAVHVQACGVTALLGGDVINHPADYGWPAIVEDPRHQNLPHADIVKMAHHGSRPASYVPMWENMVHDRATMVVAPYWPSRIPTPDLLDELAERGPLFQAASSVSSVTDEDGYTTDVTPETGVVQARKAVGSPWVVALGGPAFEVTTSA